MSTDLKIFPPTYNAAKISTGSKIYQLVQVKHGSAVYIAHIEGFLVEADSHKLLEGLGEVPDQLWGRVLGDEEEDPHGMEVSVRWFSCRHLNGGDPQGPDICL